MSWNKAVNPTKHKTVYNCLINVPRHCLLCLNNTCNSWNICDLCETDLPYLHKTSASCANYLLKTPKRKKNNTRLISFLFAAFRYEYPIKQLIIAAKFQQNLLAAHCLGQLMARSISKHSTIKTHSSQIIVPVPLHPSRLSQRGYNQAHEIAKQVTSLNCLAIDSKIVSRKKATLSQTSLNLRQRKLNLLAAFKVHKDIVGANIILVDDVISTMSTVNALASALKNRGAASVQVWACAYNETFKRRG